MEEFIYENCLLRGQHIGEYRELLQQHLVVGKQIMLRREPDNPMDKYAVAAVLGGDQICGHLPCGKSGRFAKTVSFFLQRKDCKAFVELTTTTRINLNDGSGVQIKCKLILRGPGKHVETLKRLFCGFDANEI